MKKIALKLEKLFGLTSLERTTKLECSISELKQFKNWAIEIIKEKGANLELIQKDITLMSQNLCDLIEEVEYLQDPNWNKEPEDRLTVMHEAEDTKAYQLKETPFVIAYEKEKYYVVCGSFRLSEGLETIEEAIKDADRTDWQRQLVMIQMLIENNNSITKQ